MTRRRRVRTAKGDGLLLRIMAIQTVQASSTLLLTLKSALAALNA
jgi:hypothetical protein